MFNIIIHDPLSSCLFAYGLFILFLLNFKPKYYFTSGGKIRNNLQYKLIFILLLLYTFFLVLHINTK
jgi:hypothetical protein